LTQLQQDVESVLKQVCHSIDEFSNCRQQASLDATCGHCEELKTLSNVLQQQDSQLRSLSSKNGLRKAQKEKLEAARVSIDHALDGLRAFEQELREKEKENSGPLSKDSAPLNGGTRDAEGCRVEAPEAPSVLADVKASEAPSVPADVKVQWDQLLRETADDSEMVEEFVCKICQVHVVGCGPKLTRCSHLFCGDCIATWFEVQPRSQSWAQRAQSAGLVPCPVCKEPLHEERDLFPVCATGPNDSSLLWRLLSGVKIVCANNPKCRADGRCTWVGEYGSYQKHLQTCANIPLDNEPMPLPKAAVRSAHKVPPKSQSMSSHDAGEFKASVVGQSSGPCETAKEDHKHDVRTAFGPNISQDALPVVGLKSDATPDLEEQQARLCAPGGTNSSNALPKSVRPSDGGDLTNLIQQLVNHEFEKREDVKLESQPLQPVVQQKPTVQADAAPALRVSRPFVADGASQLGVQVGDLVQVLNQHPSGWTYGRKVPQTAESAGWFPNWAIA